MTITYNLTTTKILSYPNVISQTISSTFTNAEALKKMMEQGLEAIAVIEGNSKLKAIVEREQVLARMMLALSGQL